MITFSDSRNIAKLSWASQWDGVRLKYGVKLINDKAETVFNYVGLENVESWTGRLIQNGDLPDLDGKENAATGNRFYPGNILFGKLRPYLAKVFVADEYGCCTSELLVFSPLKYDSNYLKYLILTPDFVNLVNSSTYGAKMPRASWDFIGNIFLPTPHLQTQKSIASFLDRKTATIDTLIAKKQRLIQLLEEKRTALINQAVTKGLNPNAPMKDSGIPSISKIPEHWEILQIKRAFVLQRGVDITKEKQIEGGVPVVSSGGIASYHNVAFSKAPGVVVGRKGTIGKVHYLDKNYWPHDTTLWVIEFYKNFPRFVFYKLLSMNLKNWDTGSSNPTLNRNLIHPIETCWPPSKDQIEIAHFLDSQSVVIDRISNRIGNQIEKLQEYRRSLITAAVIGKLDIREVEPNE
jgi:type I restriction enzyme, S subunit